MFGIIFYCGLAYGLGQLAPTPPPGDSSLIGLRFTVGVALLLIAIYLCAVVFALSLGMSVTTVTVLAALGWGRAALGFDRAAIATAVTHPALILPLLGAATVLAHGGIDYLPYLIDEFTNWIGVSRIIHWAGSYEAVRETLYLPGYTPGWRLLLLLPWQITGTMEPGWSAAAPFILHVAVLALVYDLVALVLQRDAGLPPASARVGAWVILLAILVAEPMGRLWTYEMLIEQPQIYLLSAAVLLLLRAELVPATHLAVHWAAGLALAGGFLLKNAVAAAAPGAGLVALLPFFEHRRAWNDRLKNSLIVGTALLAPLLVTMLSWNMIAPPDGCLASPLSVLSAGIPASYDPIDLAQRFGGAIWDYIAGYKWPVTIVALAGFALGAYAGLYRGALLWLGFSCAYMLALYWYHLTCFGDYYYQELNSIPRFTRVPLQVLHVLGLVLIVVAPLSLAGRRAAGRIPPLTRSPAVGIACLAALLALGAWQARQTYRSVADLSTRAYQILDPRVAEMQSAAEFVRRHAGRDLPSRPRLAILGQGQDGDVRAYAAYFALQPTPSGPTPLFDVHIRSSWAPAPTNAWQVSATPAEVVRELSAVDLLWPVNLDEWLTFAVLAQLVVEPGCLQRLPAVALVREVANAPRFRCLPKTD